MEKMQSRRSAIIDKIKQIVKRKQITRRWNKLTAIPAAITDIKEALVSGLSFHCDEREKDKISVIDSETMFGGVPGDVLEGHLAVYTGKEEELLERVVIPVAYLSHPLFFKLLRDAEEEFGFNYPNGRLTIPCDPAMLACIIDVVRHSGKLNHGVEIDGDSYFQPHRKVIGFSHASSIVSYNTQAVMTEKKKSVIWSYPGRMSGAITFLWGWK